MTDHYTTYSICNDSTMLSLLMLNILGCLYALAKNRYSIGERIKNWYLYTGQTTPFNNRADITPTGNFILYWQVIFCCSVIAMRHINNIHSFTDSNQAYVVFAMLASAFILFFFAKRIVYDIVNYTLFGKEQARLWKESYFFTIKITGFLLLPIATLVIIYPDISEIITVTYLLFTVIMFAIMLIIRGFNIIFNKKHYFLDIFLYLCAIELLPLCLMWHAISKTNLLEIIKI